MIRRSDILRARLAVLAVVALALSATAFGHRMPQTDTARAVAMLWGDAAGPDDICGQPDRPGHGTRQVCDACRLVGAAVLPANEAPLLGLTPRRGQAITAPAQGARHALWRDPARQARAPPRA